MPITRALSIRQPFAELILRGKKKYEYRSIPTNIRERVYVYASKKSGPEKGWKDSGFEPRSLPTGVLVGSMVIVGCQGNSGDYAWKLAHPKRLKRKIKPTNQPQPVWFRPF
ncbi:MAG: ASCH domain-containing protein [Acidobacteriaceae bacterium]